MTELTYESTLRELTTEHGVLHSERETLPAAKPDTPPCWSRGNTRKEER
ncbi:hypothetical protein [Microbispora hainanensis]